MHSNDRPEENHSGSQTVQGSAERPGCRRPLVRRLLLIGGAILALLAVVIVCGEFVAVQKAGDEAPDFTLVSSGGTRIHLGDFRGRKNVVLFFYPGDFSPGCTAEACAFRDQYDSLREHDAVLIGISHNDAGSHEKFAAAYNLPYVLLSDSDHSVSLAYGTLWLGGLIPLTKRVTVVVDKRGIIRGVFHHEFAIRRHVEDALNVLRKLE